MLTIVWNPTGFHLINVFPQGIKFNTSHYVTDILVLLLEWRNTQISGSDRKFIVHADDARPHTARVTLKCLKQNGMKRAPDPAYSPDLSPADFHLFSLRLHQATLGRTQIP
jgi:hypothetical protein